MIYNKETVFFGCSFFIDVRLLFRMVFFVKFDFSFILKVKCVVMGFRVLVVFGVRFKVLIELVRDEL